MNIHFIGDAGVSMSALKTLAESRGNDVDGSDLAHGGHKPENVENADLVVYTNAIPPDNCELVRARALGIPTIERASFLGEIARAYGKTIAVAGCHGKSTTTAMLGAIFPREKATLHVGIAGASRVGGDEFFITEACEYNRSFHRLHPNVAVILNIQYDHPDCYKTYDELVEAYATFAASGGTTIVNGDDEHCRAVAKNAITFGTGAGCDYRAENIKSDNGYRSFELVCGKTRRRVVLSVAGAHNVQNALAALAVADVCEIPLGTAVARLKSFCGVKRRFERLGIACGKTVITDYAHHPSEIRATLALAREMFPSVAVVFQPHTYTRTRALLGDFAEALADADSVALLPIFAAREKPIDGVSSELLCEKLREIGKPAEVLHTFDDVRGFCTPLKEKALLFVGAGDVDAVAARFTEM